ncbi:MAG: hypothetical protein JNK05_08005 [Myxococcales bacterium]|nr:hypothetical protein [Myxococcales bacterium]
MARRIAALSSQDKRPAAVSERHRRGKIDDTHDRSCPVMDPRDPFDPSVTPPTKSA